MNSNPQPPPLSQLSDASGKKVRKPYTITKSRESWTDEEHDKFLEALQLFDRDWKKIEDFVGSKTVIQIRSHAQKYFLKVQKNGTAAHVPPPRPKRKASHPYPQKAPKNASGYQTWEEASVLVNNATPGSMPSENEYNYLGVEADIGSKGVATISNCSMNALGSSPRAAPSSELPKQGKQSSVVHGIPDFSEVYGFIGSVFDPDSKDHVQKLKEMDPINFETALLLMRNLTLNLSSPEFKPIKEVLSAYDVHAKAVEVSPGTEISAE